jgi:hypothetical protein
MSLQSIAKIDVANLQSRFFRHFEVAPRKFLGRNSIVQE